MEPWKWALFDQTSLRLLLFRARLIECSHSSDTWHHRQFVFSTAQLLDDDRGVRLAKGRSP